MDNCKNVNINWINGYYSSSDCSIVDSNNSRRATSDYINLSKLDFNRTSSTSNGVIILCRYDIFNNLVSIERLTARDYTQGYNSVQLNENYKYKISYSAITFDNVKAYKCSSNIGTMSNELAFGTGNSLFTNLGDIVPFFIVLIGFALGFWFLKNIIRKGQKGQSL